MATKFTPGPWHVSQKSGVIVYDAYEWAICNAMTYHGRHQANEIKANACLIAASPELYNAAFDLLNRLDADRDVNDKGRWVNERNALATAIIKARGEQP